MLLGINLLEIFHIVILICSLLLFLPSKYAINSVSFQTRLKKIPVNPRVVAIMKQTRKL